MLLKKNFANINNKFCIFIYSNSMIKIFFILLEETHNNRNKIDIGFKPQV